MSFNSLIVFTISITVAVACTTAPEFTTPKFVEITYMAEHVGEDIVMQSDTLYVEQIKFLSSKITILGEDSFGIETTEELGPFLFIYTENSTENVGVFFAPFNLNVVSPLNQIGFEFSPLRAGANSPDPDFIDEELKRYTWVVRGTFNGQDFIYRSDSEFINEFFFDSVRLTDNTPVLLAEVSSNIRDIFINSSENTLYDPFDDNDMEQVLILFEQTLSLSASRIQ